MSDRRDTGPGAPPPPFEPTFEAEGGWEWEQEVVGRETLEVAGLMAQALDPIRPSPPAKVRLLEQIRLDSRDGAAAPSADGPHREPAKAPGARAGSGAPVGRGRPARPAPSPPAGAPAGLHRAFRWAASVGVVATAAAIWFGAELALLRRESDQLRIALAGVEEKLRAEQSASRELARVRRDLDLVTSAEAVVARLEPPSGGAPPVRARGTLFVAPDHQHWYLALEGLEPAPEGHVYHLWFIAAGRPIAAGAFDARPGERVELRSDTMPEGTAAVAISIESRAAGERPPAPATGPLLVGTRIVRLG